MATRRATTSADVALDLWIQAQRAEYDTTISDVGDQPTSNVLHLIMVDGSQWVVIVEQQE